MAGRAARVAAALVLAGAMAAILVLAAVAVGPARLAAALGRLHPGWVAAAGAAYLVLWLAKAEKWRRLMALDGIAVGRATAVSALLVANGANLLVPAKAGDMLRGLAARRASGAAFWRCMGASVLDRVLDLAGILAVAGLALLATPRLDLPRDVVLGLQAAAVVGLALVAALLASRPLLAALDRVLLHRLKATQAALAQAAQPVDALRRRPLATAALALASVAVWLAEGGCTVLLAHGVVPAGQPALAVLAVAAANLTKTLPLTPGGVGPYEAALAAVLAVGGVAPAAALAVGIADHALKNALTLLPAVPASWRLGVSLWAPRPAAAE
jgi:uncharacterized protein (TIRG00374 family)